VNEDLALTTSRVVAASPARVYEAFEDPKQLARWWGPNGFTSTFETFDFREGGAWKFVLHGPDGKNYPNMNRFVELVPAERMRLQHVEGHWFELTVTLTPEGHKTRIGWRQQFANEEELLLVRDYVIPANEENLDRLEAVLSGRTP
jgi:uncharacterized protein YndB with AHSA1/START domain